MGELRRKQSGAAELVPRAQVPVARHSRNRGHAQPTQRWPAALLASAREMADESGFSLDDMSPAERDEFLGRGGQASSAAEIALVADAFRVAAGQPARSYDELIQATELPRHLPHDFIEQEPEWITVMRRRCKRLESRNAELEERVVALEVEAAMARLVADVESTE